MNRRRRRSGLLTLLFFPVVLTARFMAGRVLWRRASSWDARYLTWAADPPPWVYAMRDETRPRSRWARRPGWHRQVARLAPVAAVLALTHAPITPDSITAAVVALGALAFVVTRRPRARSARGAVGTLLLEERADAARRAVPPPRKPMTGSDDPDAGQIYTSGRTRRAGPSESR